MHGSSVSTSYQPIAHTPDPKLDLLLERVVDVATPLVWAAWTNPEYLKAWFTPAPWKTVECELDLRPGGIFRTVMESPEGQRFPGSGCFLEVIEHRRLVWTSALLPGFRPVKAERKDGGKECDEMLFTAVISMMPEGNKTRYSALAIHKDPEACARHEAMGFHTGWGSALDQLVALMKTKQL